MIIGRLLSWILVGCAFLVLGHDILQYLNTEAWHSILLGELWYNLNPQGINLMQAVIQRYLTPVLWDPIILTVLLWPAWLVFIVPGVVFLLLFRKRRSADTRRFYS
ncbi:MAG: hypothetical protein CMN56_15960 [Sneathiella sp.]|uniref:hypothetical protein n=1 Tax=Sneathiella sp. TaxID=1964365 RepID=UPI000C46E3A9|nr:hypothetical protein [Sneathiella sp.]MAZ04630.1 hypothetical protein [Sneathiella sp.]